MELSIAEITALVLGTMYGSRMIFMMAAPKAHAPLQRDLYNQRRVQIKRWFYIIVSVLSTWLLISGTSVVYFILALFSIGALYDLLFTYYDFPESAVLEAKQLANEKIPVEIPSFTTGKLRWYIGIPSVGFVLWLYWYVFVG